MPPLYLSRLMPDVADNSKRAIVRTVARAIGSDLSKNPNTLETLLIPAGGASHTPLGKKILVVDTCLPEIETPYLLIAHLRYPINILTPDQQAVDLIAVLLSSPSDRIGHLRRVALLMRRLHDDTLINILRTSRSIELARALLNEPGHHTHRTAA